MTSNWDKPYKCHHVGCARRFASASSVQKHIKKTHPQVIRRAPPGSKPIYAVAAFRRRN